MSVTPSKACCTVPPVVQEGYKEKGKYIDVAGFKTYSTGPSSAKKGIVVVYDIFGFFSQTIQGADIVSAGDSENQYQVFMPDWFDGKPFNINDFPPDTEEKGKKLQEFFKTSASPPKTLENLSNVLAELKKSTGIETWGIMGYCWGGKIVNLSTQKGTQFKAAVAMHPAMVDAADAPGIEVPYLMIPSKGESKDDVEKWQKGVTVKNAVEWFPDDEHGFMAARANLSNEAERKSYEKGYKLVLDWFHEHL